MTNSSYYRHAITLLQTFKLDSIITHGDFDKWAIKCGILKPPSSTEQGSDGWLAHIQRRHQVRYAINNAASNLRMREEAGVEPYVIERVGTDQYHIRRLHIAVLLNKATERVQSYMMNKQILFEDMVNVMDWSQISPYIKMNAEYQIQDLETISRMTTTMLEIHDQKCARFIDQLVKMMNDGRIPRKPELDTLVVLATKKDENNEDEEED
jgi:hypothetical protein